MDMVRGHVLCCGGTGCTSSGSEGIIAEMEAQLRIMDNVLRYLCVRVEE